MNHSIYQTIKNDYHNLRHNIVYQDGGKTHGLTITSNSFRDNASIPNIYAKAHGNKSPHIKIENIPKDTKQLVLLLYDPDAQPIVGKTFVHWYVVLNPTNPWIEIKEGQGNLRTTMKNDAGNRAYDGPFPPSGSGVHSYHFAVYALDTGSDELNLDTATFNSQQNKNIFNSVQELIKGHVIAHDEIIGKYVTKK
jgi:Raf kinase inhibitor-like YbhB/YbcL family protein